MFLSKKLLISISDVFKKLSNEELTKSFNNIGVEVENIHNHNQINNLVFGKLLDFKKIEGSEHLNLCRVQTKDELLDIVCGAKNLEQNKIVVVAKIGAQLSKDVVIQKRKILEHYSEGMLCSYGEILKSNENFMNHDDKRSIIIIDESQTNIENSVYDFLNLDDEIFELSLPSNRNELNGVYFLLNELKNQINFEFKLPSKMFLDKKSENIIIESKNVNNYIIAELNNVQRKTNWFIKTILVNSRINVANDLVDLGTFASLLTANPVHIYDKDKIHNSLRIIDSYDTSEFKTINGTNLKFPKNSTIAISNQNISCLIGIIGSEMSMIDKETKNIIIEILNINDQYIKKLSEELNIQNHSSQLFSKKISNSIVKTTFLVLNKLFDEKLKIVASNTKTKTKIIKTNSKQISKLLGIKINNLELTKILSKTGIIHFFNHVLVPGYRTDLNNTNDIAEEVLKSFDINKFSEKPVDGYHLIKQYSKNKEYQKIYEFKNKLTTLGFYETKTLNLTSEAKNKMFNYQDLVSLEIANPISNKRQYFRNSLLPNLIEVYENNFKRKQGKYNLFEIQDIYSKEKIIKKLSLLVSKKLIFDVSYKQEILEHEVKLILNFISNYFEINLDIKESDYNIISNKQFSINLNNEKIGICLKYNNEETKSNLFLIELDLNKLLINDKEIKKISSSSSLNPIYRELTFYNPNKVNIKDYFDSITQKYNNIEVKLISYFKKDNKEMFSIEIKINQLEKQLISEEIEEIFNFCIDNLKHFNLIIKDDK